MNECGAGAIHYISDAKEALRLKHCPDGLIQLHLLGFISGAEVVNAIYECYHDDNDGLSDIAQQLRKNVDNNLASIADWLDDLNNGENAT